MQSQAQGIPMAFWTLVFTAMMGFKEPTAEAAASFCASNLPKSWNEKP